MVYVNYFSIKLGDNVLSGTLRKTHQVFNIVGFKDFSHSSVGKKICLPCRRPGFDSWVGKIPWRRKDRGAWWSTVHGVTRVGNDLPTKSSLVVQCLDMVLPLQMAVVQSLVRELRYHVTWGVAKKKKEEEQKKND